MPHRDTRHREDALRDALAASTRIMAWVAGKTLANYEADEYMQSAIERQFEILAEALNIVDRSDPSLRETLPEVGEIIGMRNAIAHAYFRIDNDIVWSATQSLLPDVRTRIRLLLGDDTIPSTATEE